MKGKIAKIAGLLLLLALVAPVPLQRMDDGGTLSWCALLYRVDRHHALMTRDGQTGYAGGTTVYILGFEVFSDFPRDFVPTER